MQVRNDPNCRACQSYFEDDEIEGLKRGIHKILCQRCGTKNFYRIGRPIIGTCRFCLITDQEIRKELYCKICDDPIASCETCLMYIKQSNLLITLCPTHNTTDKKISLSATSKT